MLLLCIVDGLSLVFAVVFLKWRSDINMLQVEKRMMMMMTMTIKRDVVTITK